MSTIKIYRTELLQTTLNEINQPVQIIYQAVAEPETQTVEAVQQLQKLSPHLSLTIQTADMLLTDRLTVATEATALFFVGAPVGTEIAALVSAIVVAGRGRSGLQTQTRQQLAQLKHPVQLEIFTTPTCPTCSQTVSLGHKFALESPHVTTYAISAPRQPELAQQYKILGTPHMVVDGQYHQRGRLTEADMLTAILKQ